MDTLRKGGAQRFLQSSFCILRSAFKKKGAQPRSPIQSPEEEKI